MSWGTSPWGTGGWGSLSATMTVVRAFAISTHEVVVVLSKPPQDTSPFLVGDVRRGDSWSLTVPATAEVLEVVGVFPYVSDTEWVVRSLQRFPDSTGTARIKATLLKDAAGGIVGPPDFADFTGVTEAAIMNPEAQAASKRVGGRDLANIPATTVGAETNLSGTLVIRGGDYALVEGPELLKKLIIRRLTTVPGEFFHIPSYGVGLKVKQPIPAGDLVKLRSQIERQVMQEKDVATVRTAVFQTNGVLTVKVKAVLARTGQQVSVGLDSPIGQGM